ncbi:hypothetical protein F5Y04DRAFT_44875 [Hypomontagnella monticulosa]|nr:hypothetical protein F5Y04DRAFT_44875 [Hypomontagnella monticulosa]
MKSSRSVCLLCRHIATTSGGLRASQWQTQAIRFSTTTPSRGPNPNVGTTARPSDESPPTDTVVDTPGQNNIRKILRDERKGKPKVNWSRGKPRNDPAKDSARVDALFQQIVHQQTTAENAPPAASSPNAGNDLALVQAIGKLERMIEGDESVSNAFDYLKTEIYPILQDPDVTIPKVFYRVVNRLMDRVIAAKKEAMRSPTLPTVAEIFRVYADIGEMKPQRWSTLVGKLVQGIVEMDPSTEQHDSSKAEDGLISQDAMLADLVDSWRVLSLPKVVPVTPNDEVTDGFWFPRLDKFSLERFSRKGNFPAAFSSVFPHHHPNQLGAPAAVLAIATYALLHDAKRSNADVRRSATRFVSKVASLITFVDFRDAALQREISSTFPSLETYIMSRWPGIKQELKEKLNSKNTPTASTQSHESSSSTSEGGINAHFLGTRLGQAYQSYNVREVDNLWQKFVGVSEQIPPGRIAELQKHPNLFNSFIHYRMALNQPDQAVAVLHTLRKVGLKPTIKTWNGMLDGCKKARNLNGLKNVWAKIAGSGMKLDTRIWTTLVSGLIECGDVQGAIKALEEMARLWNESSKDENAAAVKPTVEPLNAALTGLIHRGQVSVAESLLAWAGKQGIEPDVFTFNTLLRRFVRDGREKDVQRLFDIMQNTGVGADEATFTVVLDAAFSRIASDDTEEKVRAVASVIHDMKAAGLEANLHTYGKMIYHLLRSGDGAKDAIKFVLAHLWEHGHELSPHIYTMLVEHYFTRDPPDLDAVESLIQRRRLLDYDDMDTAFYDTVVNGYTLVGHPDKALEIYYRLSDSGVVIILSTQMELLRALLRQDRVDDARAMVANTKRLFEESRRHIENMENAGFWNHPFWRLAEQHGIFERANVGAGAAPNSKGGTTSD